MELQCLSSLSLRASVFQLVKIIIDIAGWRVGQCHQFSYVITDRKLVKIC